MHRGAKLFLVTGLVQPLSVHEAAIPRLTRLRWVPSAEGDDPVWSEHDLRRHWTYESRGNSSKILPWQEGVGTLRHSPDALELDEVDRKRGMLVTRSYGVATAYLKMGRLEASKRIALRQAVRSLQEELTWIKDACMIYRVYLGNPLPDAPTAFRFQVDPSAPKTVDRPGWAHSATEEGGDLTVWLRLVDWKGDRAHVDGIQGDYSSSGGLEVRNGNTVWTKDKDFADLLLREERQLRGA